MYPRLTGEVVWGGVNPEGDFGVVVQNRCGVDGQLGGGGGGCSGG